jgi:hypothetical protein
MPWIWIGIGMVVAVNIVNSNKWQTLDQRTPSAHPDQTKPNHTTPSHSPLIPHLSLSLSLTH